MSQFIVAKFRLESELRRVSFKSDVTNNEIYKITSEIFAGCGLPENFKLVYVDDDGDEITLTRNEGQEISFAISEGTARFTVKPNTINQSKPAASTSTSAFADNGVNSIQDLISRLASGEQNLTKEDIEKAAADVLGVEHEQLLKAYQNVKPLFRRGWCRQWKQQRRAAAAAAATAAATAACQSPNPASPFNPRHSARCDYCQNGIVGIRYKCGNCADWDLCETCEALPREEIARKTGHSGTHLFIKIRNPLQGCPHSEPLLSKNLYENAQPFAAGGYCHVAGPAHFRRRGVDLFHSHKRNPCGQGNNWNLARVVEQEPANEINAKPGSFVTKIWKLESEGFSFPPNARIVRVSGPEASHCEVILIRDMSSPFKIEVKVVVQVPNETGLFNQVYVISGGWGRQVSEYLQLDIVVADEKEEQKEAPVVVPEPENVNKVEEVKEIPTAEVENVVQISSPKKNDGEKRKPSSYNVFVKKEMAKIKTEEPSIQHKEAFKLAASRWKDAPENSESLKVAAAVVNVKSSEEDEKQRVPVEIKSNIEKLTDMGFDVKVARTALITSNDNLEAAVQLLLDA